MIESDKMESSRTVAASADFSQLEASIKANKGIFQPIHVLELEEKEEKYKYIVSEGNTRLAVYKILNSYSNPEPWTNQILCCILDGSDDFEEVMAMAHIVGVKEWPPYARAKKMASLQKNNEVAFEKILAKCGSSASKGRLMVRINAFNHMENVKKIWDPASNDFIKGPKTFTPQLFSFFEEYNRYRSKFMPDYDDEKFAKDVRTGKLSNARQVAPLARLFETSQYREKFLNSEQYKDDVTPLLQEFKKFSKNEK